ncbi:MAG: hypothetical protein NT023_25340 [Armatimonadetes bacterium]|nr:hypothetical protein [Armatimonadota bacterium]
MRLEACARCSNREQRVLSYCCAVRRGSVALGGSRLCLESVLQSRRSVAFAHYHPNTWVRRLMLEAVQTEANRRV